MAALLAEVVRLRRAVEAQGERRGQWWCRGVGLGRLEAQGERRPGFGTGIGCWSFLFQQQL